MSTSPSHDQHRRPAIFLAWRPCGPWVGDADMAVLIFGAELDIRRNYPDLNRQRVELTLSAGQSYLIFVI